MVFDSELVEILEEEFKAKLSTFSVSQMCIDFTYAADAGRVAQMLAENEIKFCYETDEIFLTLDALNELETYLKELWGE